MFLKRRSVKWLLTGLGAAFIALQFTNPPHTNPVIDPSKALESIAAVPPEVAVILARSCNDCHSNKTDWRWYTYVAPVSWLTVGHVNDAREELNFSEWGTYGTRRQSTRLNAVCDQCQRGEMPLASYALVHPEVRLSPGEVKLICEWTSRERSRLAGEH
jgi:hypothetical protein